MVREMKAVENQVQESERSATHGEVLLLLLALILVVAMPAAKAY